MSDRMYSEKEIQFIADNYEHMTLKQLRKATGRSESGILYQIKKLGLEKGIIKKPENDYIKSLIEKGYRNIEIQKLVKEKFGIEISQTRICYYKETTKREYIGKDLGDKNNYFEERGATRKLKEGEKNTAKIGDFKVTLVEGDTIKIKGSRTPRKVFKKYPNFVQVKINGRLDSVMYCDIICKVC